MKKSYFYHTAIGGVTIAEKDGYITDLRFGGPSANLGENTTQETPLIKQAAIQLQEYLTGERQEFDLPLKPSGTEFQKKVWKALCDIPYGETRTYGEVALRVGSPRASRAVGRSNNRNPISIFIPCHRVIGGDGKLVGYGGGLDIKKKLLELEQAGNDQKLF